MTACDCHVHVFGPRERYPQLPTRSYTGGLAPLNDLRAHGAPFGITRFVIVQASVHGTDNSCLLDTLDALDGHGRGVVVVDPAAIAPSALDDWSRRGARGLRINLYSDYKRGAPDRRTLQDRFQALVDLAPPGWHIEVIAPLRLLAEAAPLLASARVPIVIDHYGLPGGEPPGGDNGHALLDLLKCPHVWMKLSGPYRAIEGPGSDPHATTPPLAWMQALLDTAPDRLVWGSDWPHTPPHEESRCGDAPDPFRPIAYGQLFGDFRLAAGSNAHRILTENPARLYGFG